MLQKVWAINGIFNYFWILTYVFWMYMSFMISLFIEMCDIYFINSQELEN